MIDEQKWYVAVAAGVSIEWHLAPLDELHGRNLLQTMCGALIRTPCQAVRKLCKADLACTSCESLWKTREAKRKHVTRRCGTYAVDVTGAPDAVERAFKAFAVVHSAWAAQSEALEHARKAVTQ